MYIASKILALPMNKSQRPQVFIEKIMPVKLLNEQVYYEHGGNPFKGFTVRVDLMKI